MLPTESDFDNPITYRGVVYDADETIGTATAARIARRNRRTIINWCIKEYLPSRQVGGPKGQYEITISDLIKVLETPGSKVRRTEDAVV